MTHIFLQAAGGGLGSFLPLILVLVVMYFFFFRPQLKRQKEEKKFQQEITKGMRVVTSSGIHGKILSVDEATVVIESENSRLKVDRSTVSKQMSAAYLPKDSKDKKEKEKSDEKQKEDKN